MEIIKTKSLSIGYGKSTVVSGINIALNAGDMVALIGPNGAGKSTLFKTFSSHIQPVGGSIEIMGRDLSSYSPNERAKLLGIVLTERPDDMFLNVYDVVASGRYPYTGMFGKLNENDEKIIKESLDIIGIYKLIDRRFCTLSDGEKQKVMIAKSIAQNTPVIILDEPTAFLDYPSKIELLSILKTLTTEKGKAILFSSHDMELTLRYTDKLWIMAKGMPFMSGNCIEMAEKGIIKNYLGLKDEEYEFLFKNSVNLQTNF
ncbi:MAG: ABC transporter ATP-binding protein [Candidatus Limimorpha sp.]